MNHHTTAAWDDDVQDDDNTPATCETVEEATERMFYRHRDSGPHVRESDLDRIARRIYG